METSVYVRLCLINSCLAEKLIMEIEKRKKKGWHVLIRDIALNDCDVCYGIFLVFF